MPEQEVTFRAKVKIVGINPYVEIPEYVVLSLEGGQKAAVMVRVAPPDQRVRFGRDSVDSSHLERNVKLV